jgi:signal recognition particle receptor subunit beta
MNLENAKLVFAGPVGAGKTTAIRSIADDEPISTEVPMTDGALGDKTTTTVALDFSTVILDDGTRLLVYGLPGQDHFSFMRPIVIQGAVGVIVLLDARDLAIANHCENWLRAVRAIEPAMPIGIGITQSDLYPHFSLGDVRAAIRRCGSPVPVFTVDVRSREQTSHLIRAMLISLQ